MPLLSARHWLITGLLPASLGLLGCEEEAPPTPAATAPLRRVRVGDLIERLRGPDAAARANAGLQLMAMGREGFAPKDGIRLLRAAAEPAARGGDRDPSVLVRAASARPGPDDVAVVLERFNRYDADSRKAALDLLARLPDRRAAEALMRLVRAHARSDGLAALPVGPLSDLPRHPDVYFPALLDYLDRSELRPGICRIAAAFADAGLLDGRLLGPHAARLADLLEARLDVLLDPNGPGEAAAEPEVRREACALLDLAPGVATPELEVGLNRALSGRDPEVVAHAAVAQLRRGRPVDPEALAVAAARPEVRAWLWGRLVRIGQLDVLPERYRTQAALAESELVAWLARSPALGRPPDAIEPAGDLTFRSGFAPARRYYLFRFRVDAPESLADRGWMAGWVSYPPSGEPALGGQAGSRFLPWDDRTPLGHITGGQEMGAEPSDGEPEE